MSYKPILLLTLLAASFFSCKNDADEIPFTTGIAYSIINIDAPETGNVNETIPVSVDFTVINGCGQFNQFIEEDSGTTFQITVEAKYEGMICTQDIPIRNVTYNFSADEPGEYTLVFLSNQNTSSVQILIE